MVGFRSIDRERLKSSVLFFLLKYKCKKKTLLSIRFFRLFDYKAAFENNVKIRYSLIIERDKNRTK